MGSWLYFHSHCNTPLHLRSIKPLSWSPTRRTTISRDLLPLNLLSFQTISWQYSWHDYDYLNRMRMRVDEPSKSSVHLRRIMIINFYISISSSRTSILRQRFDLTKITMRPCRSLVKSTTPSRQWSALPSPNKLFRWQNQVSAQLTIHCFGMIYFIYENNSVFCTLGWNYVKNKFE